MKVLLFAALLIIISAQTGWADTPTVHNLRIEAFAAVFADFNHFDPHRYDSHQVRQNKTLTLAEDDSHYYVISGSTVEDALMLRRLLAREDIYPDILANGAHRKRRQYPRDFRYYSFTVASITATRAEILAISTTPWLTGVQSGHGDQYFLSRSHNKWKIRSVVRGALIVAADPGVPGKMQRGRLSMCDCCVLA